MKRDRLTNIDSDWREKETCDHEQKRVREVPALKRQKEACTLRPLWRPHTSMSANVWVSALVLFADPLKHIKPHVRFQLPHKILSKIRAKTPRGLGREIQWAGAETGNETGSNNRDERQQPGLNSSHAKHLHCQVVTISCAHSLVLPLSLPSNFGHCWRWRTHASRKLSAPWSSAHHINDLDDICARTCTQLSVSKEN